MKRKAYSITVRGKVQGVGFRYYTLKKAQELGLRGYVRNQPDGSVYIEIEATDSVCEVFIEWCRTGPSRARVDDLELNEIRESGYNDFRIR